MKWISILHKILSGIERKEIEWKEEGWFFDKPKEDYGARLRCKKCGSTPRVDECRKFDVTSMQGDSCGSPVFHLICTQCHGMLAIIDEGSSEYRPKLILDRDGEFVNPPSTISF